VSGCGSTQTPAGRTAIHTTAPRVSRAPTGPKAKSPVRRLPMSNTNTGAVRMAPMTNRRVISLSSGWCPLLRECPRLERHSAEGAAAMLAAANFRVHGTGVDVPRAGGRSARDAQPPLHERPVREHRCSDSDIVRVRQKFGFAAGAAKEEGRTRMFGRFLAVDEPPPFRTRDHARFLKRSPSADRESCAQSTPRTRRRGRGETADLNINEIESIEIHHLRPCRDKSFTNFSSSPHTHKLRQLRAAASASRRSDRPGWRPLDLARLAVAPSYAPSVPAAGCQRVLMSSRFTRSRCSEFPAVG